MAEGTPAIAKGTKNLDLALKYVSFAIDADVQANNARLFLIPPVNQQAKLDGATRSAVPNGPEALKAIRRPDWKAINQQGTMDRSLESRDSRIARLYVWGRRSSLRSWAAPVIPLSPGGSPSAERLRVPPLARAPATRRYGIITFASKSAAAPVQNACSRSVIAGP